MTNVNQPKPSTLKRIPYGISDYDISDYGRMREGNGYYEYDNFTNTILATQGQQAYHEVTHGAGFYRYHVEEIGVGLQSMGERWPMQKR